MTTPNTPPPPYSPYDPFSSTPAPAPAPTSARRTGWQWRGVVAGAVAGGVLAASVAVPVTWAITRSDVAGQGAPTTSSTTLAPPAQQANPYGQADPGSQTDPYSQFGQGDQSTDPGTGTGTGTDGSTNETNASDAQSQGVVLIDTTLTGGEAAGTGLVLDQSGLVLTNYHVVEGSTSVKVTIATDGTTYDAKVIGHDQKADIALLQLDDASGLATVDLDDEGDPAVSDTVTAVGNAEGQGYLSASSGSVVSLDQSITTAASGPVAGEDLTGLIQTNAYVVGGYSGGALLDDEGEVVGITTAASSGGAAESYAVPIADALKVAEQIESGDETDQVEIGAAAYLGIGVTGSDAATGSGLAISQVEDGGAAAGAGVVAGDTLTTVGDTSITSYDVLHSALATYQPGDRVSLGWTDASGAAQTATVTLGTSPVN